MGVTSAFRSVGLPVGSVAQFEAALDQLFSFVRGREQVPDSPAYVWCRSAASQAQCKHPCCRRRRARNREMGQPPFPTPFRLLDQ